MLPKKITEAKKGRVGAQVVEYLSIKHEAQLIFFSGKNSTVLFLSASFVNMTKHNS
jgi:hypothetical protein